MIHVKCLVACDIAETADRSRVMHLKTGNEAELAPTRDLLTALRERKVEIVGRPSSADLAELERIAGEAEIDAGKARMEAAIAAQVRADAAALASASDAEIVATVAAQQAQAAPPAGAPAAAPRVARAPRRAK